MRYFLLLCTILFLQVFMPSGRILAAVPVTTQLSATSYAAIQPIEPTRTKKRFRLHKNIKYKAKPAANSDVLIAILIMLGLLLLLGVYVMLPVGAILGITWLWITSLSVQIAVSLYILFLLEADVTWRYRGHLTGMVGTWHLVAFFIVFLIAVFFLYNILLFFILSGLVVALVVLALIIT
jgi:hypothetical protein